MPPAAVMGGLVREEVKTERLSRLQALLREQHETFNNNCIGKTISVLFDGRGNRPGQLYGRTAYNQPIHVTAPARLFGQIENVIVTGANGTSLSGTVEIAETVSAA